MSLQCENTEPDSVPLIETNVLLAVTIPEGVTEGSTFYVTADKAIFDTPQKNIRSFEVTVPEGNIPGEIINIIIPTDADITIESNTYFNTVDAVLASSKETAIQQARELNDAYKVTERIKNIDDAYKISQTIKYLAYYPQKIGSAAVGSIQTIDAKLGVSATVSSTIAKVQELEVSKKAIKIGGSNIAFAREVDTKLCVSATSARVVVGGANVCLAAWRKALAVDAEYRILERTGLKKKTPSEEVKESST